MLRENVRGDGECGNGGCRVPGDLGSLCMVERRVHFGLRGGLKARADECGCDRRRWGVEFGLDNPGGRRRLLRRRWWDIGHSDQLQARSSALCTLLRHSDTY